MGPDPYDLNRFVTAQNSGATYGHALAEIRAGRKTGHWMWFVFPQIAGLGFSAMSRKYAITGLDEARAYLGHDPLGGRLRECATVVAGLDASPVRVFGGIDAQKLRSSMTLFHLADPAEAAFGAVLDRHFDGVLDDGTQTQLGH